MARILLIDDDDLVRKMLSLTLAHFGHTVVEARNGKEGMRLLAQSKADLIITDLVMPEKDGFEILLELRGRQPAVKIIVISGGVRGDLSSYLEIAQRLGAAKVLAKPFANEALLAAIDELLTEGGPPLQPLI